MLKRAASPPISPPARIIDRVWAPSSGPAQAGLAPRSLTRNGMNSTLIAPTPSMTTDTPPRAATSQRGSGDDPQAVGDRAAQAL